jgi:hypothetical protein
MTFTNISGGQQSIGIVMQGTFWTKKYLRMLLDEDTALRQPLQSFFQNWRDKEMDLIRYENLADDL